MTLSRPVETRARTRDRSRLAKIGRSDDNGRSHHYRKSLPDRPGSTERDAIPGPLGSALLTPNGADRSASWGIRGGHGTATQVSWSTPWPGPACGPTCQSLPSPKRWS